MTGSPASGKKKAPAKSGGLFLHGALNPQVHYGLMVAPGFLWLLLFSIVPMAGVLMAFEDFNPGRGLFRSEWVGLENFEYMFSMGDATRVIANTFIIAAAKVVLNLVIPLIFALLLNEVKSLFYKKAVQTIVYLPHFLSWVILASIVLSVFGYRGAVNTIGSVFGAEPRVWVNEGDVFRTLVIWSDVWKEFGFNAVIFLAALTGISPNLYEAAAIDGAGRFQSIWHITLPGIVSTIILLGVLGLGNVLNAGFDQIFNLYNPMVYNTGDVIDTWVYRLGLLDLQFSLATAAGLFKSAVSFVLIVISYVTAYKVANYRVF